MKRIAVVLAAIACVGCAGPVAAFELADGSTVQCSAGGQWVEEKFAAPGDPVFQSRTALTARTGGTWQITWNADRLKTLPPEVRDFLFFHECAHAHVPTENELEANCTGLKDMRAAGRAGSEFEARLRRHFARNSAYWNDTFKCADGGPVPVTPKPAG